MDLRTLKTQLESWEISWVLAQGKLKVGLPSIIPLGYFACDLAFALFFYVLCLVGLQFASE